MQEHGVLIIDANDWDREHMRSYLGGLSMPVRVVQPRDVASPKSRVDVIILGFTDAVALDTSRAQLEETRRLHPNAQLILCCPANVEGLDHKVLQLNARAFLLKPVVQETFTTLLEETLSQIHLRRERKEYARGSKKPAKISEIIGSSESINEVLQLLERVAESTSTSVLLLGESGVGKSLFAQTVHEMCEGAHGPFIEINCAALPPQLLESELFGYEPGAFTDARNQKTGLIELADGGTLFLDEITEVDLVTQAKLLKFLDTKRFRRLGGETEISVDVRIVAASNRDIREQVRTREFREDLYYRLNVVEVNIPPLRDRREDIDMIASYYLDFYKKKFKKPKLELSPEAWTIIRSYTWPGNVRELINVLERAALLTPDPTITPERLPIETPREAPSTVTLRRSGGELDLVLPAEGVRLDVVERLLIERTLQLTSGNVSRAAEMLGISRGSLRNRLSKLRIDARSFQRNNLVTV